MLSIRTLYLLQYSELSCNLVDIMLVMRIDGLISIYPALLFIFNNIVFSFQFLEFVGNLELQSRVNSEIIQQIVQISQLLILCPRFSLDLIKVVVNLHIRITFLLSFMTFLQILQIPQSSFI